MRKNMYGSFEELGLLLKYLRKNRGMTISQLSKSINASPGTISKVENGVYGRLPSGKYIELTALALRVNPEALKLEASPKNIRDICLRNFYEEGSGIDNRAVNLQRAIKRVLDASCNYPIAQ